MKRFVICLLWIILAATAIRPAAAVGVIPEAESTPTASPTPVPTTEETSLRWNSLNGPHERVAFALALVPDRGALYAGTWGHGVYRSWDGGQTWYPGGIGGAPFIKVLAVLPSSSQTIYAGSYQDGLHRSSDDGFSWQQLGRPPDPFVRLNPKHPNRSPLYIESLLVFSDQGKERILVGTRNGAWIGDAQGDAWTQLSAGFADTDEAYTVHALARDASGRLYAGTLDGLYAIQDGGQIWQFMGPAEDFPDEARQILSLAIVTSAANDTGTLLVGTRGAGVYALDLEAQAWLPRNEGFPDDERARTIQALLSAPDGTAYAGTVDFGVFKTTDGGQTWQQMADGLPSNSRSILSLAQDPSEGILYAGTYGDSVYQLRPDSQTWESANTGLPVDFAVQKIAFAGPEGERLLAALKVGGVYLNTNRHEASPTWSRLPEALRIGPARDVSGLAISGKDRTTVVAAAGDGVHRSTDAGKSWDHVTSDLLSAKRAKALAQGRRNVETLYVALEEVGVHHSDDAGKTWKSALGDLAPEWINQISCMTIGADDKTVYLGLQFGQVYVTHDAGATWQPLSAIETVELRELASSQRTAWDVFLHGGPRRMLYARTTDAIYVSHDGGRSWQLRLRGFFSALLADPYRPWMVYVASPATTLEKKPAAPILLTPDLWISKDGGETWTRTKPPSSESSPVSITTLAFDPKDNKRLYAGTEGSGVFWAELPSHTRSFTPRAVGLIVIVLLLLAALAFILWAGLSVDRRFRPPPHTWLQLALLRVFRPTEVGLISDRHTPLTSLECLVFALAPDKPFQPQNMWQTLNKEDIPADLGQMEAALQKLTADYNLLRSSERTYRQQWPLLGRMAWARFWEDAEQREGLIKEIQDQSRLRADIRRFFRLAGFEAFSFDAGFRVTSNQPEYALLGAGRGIYVHPHTATVEAIAIKEVQDNAYRAYGSQLASRIAFLVVDSCPQPEALQEIVRLQREEDFRPVLIPRSVIRHSAEAPTSCQALDRSLQRSLGDQDLFALVGPARNPLDFWGREADVQRLVEACADGQVVGLGGTTKVGKTSLVWQVMDRLPNALIARLELDGPPTRDLYGDIRRQWLADARIRFPTWEPPQQELAAEPIVEDLIAADLKALCASLRDQGLAIDLAASIDGLADPQTGAQSLEPLARAVAATPDVSLVCVFSRPGQCDTFEPHLLLPLEREDSAGLVNALATQMGFEFDEGAVDHLYQASGGHPLILRQLASRSVIQNKGTGEQIQAADVDQAVEWYIAQGDSALNGLWESLTEEEQRVVQAVVAGKPPPAGEPLRLLENLGWLRPVEGGWELFSHALIRWLETHRPRCQ